MFIPDPGSEFFPSRIQGQKIPGSASASRNLSILTQKIVSKLSEIWSRMIIPDPDLDFLHIPDPGVKKAPDPQHCFLWEGSYVDCGFVQGFLEMQENKQQIIGSSTACLMMLSHTDLKLYTANIGMHPTAQHVWYTKSPLNLGSALTRSWKLVQKFFVAYSF